MNLLCPVQILGELRQQAGKPELSVYTNLELLRHTQQALAYCTGVGAFGISGVVFSSASRIPSEFSSSSSASSSESVKQVTVCQDILA